MNCPQLLKAAAGVTIRGMYAVEEERQRRVIKRADSVFCSAFTVTGYAQEGDLLASLRHYQKLQASMFARTHLLGVTSVENKEQMGEEPPLRGVRIVGEISAGGLGGLAAAVVPAPIEVLTWEETDGSSSSSFTSFEDKV